jgi:hypothetical protein
VSIIKRITQASTPNTSTDAPSGGSTDIFETVNDAIDKGVPTRDPADGHPLHSPAHTDTSHVGLRADQFATAAVNAADRDGHRENLEAKADAAATVPAVRHNRARRGEARKEVKRLTRLIRKLSPYSYQSEHVARYLLFTAAMVVVDVASVVGASNNAVGDNGVLPWLMGLGIGVSIVSVGAAAGGLKREAHERATRRAKPPKALKNYPTLFGPAPGAGRWGDNLLAGGFVLVAVAIFVLRSIVAGGQLGLGYAAMSGLTLLGSYANSYVFGPFDKAAATLRNLNADRAQAKADRDAAEKIIENAAGLVTRPKSIKKIYRSEGKAAAALIKATAHHGIVLDHPSSFGTFEHDPSTTKPKKTAKKAKGSKEANGSTKATPSTGTPAMRSTRATKPTAPVNGSSTANGKAPA